MRDSLNPAGRLHDSRAPVLHALLSTLWMYPLAGQSVEVGGVVVRSTFSLETSHVRLTVMLSKAGEPAPEPDPGLDLPVA